MSQRQSSAGKSLAFYSIWSPGNPKYFHEAEDECLLVTSQRFRPIFLNKNLRWKEIISKIPKLAKFGFLWQSKNILAKLIECPNPADYYSSCNTTTACTWHVISIVTPHIVQARYLAGHSGLLLADLCLWSLHTLLLRAWVHAGSSSFLPQSKNTSKLCVHVSCIHYIGGT